MRSSQAYGRAVVTTLAFIAAAAVSGCDKLKDDLLEAPDPDIINPGSVQSPAGANAVRLGALSRLRDLAGGAESTWLFGGLLADEWSTSSTFVQNDETDERQTSTNNGTVQGELRRLYRVRTSANQATQLLKEFKPSPLADIGEMYFSRGFAELQLASDFCNGIPLSDGLSDPVTYGMPLPVADLFTIAVASFDSAIALSSGTDAASVTMNRASRIAKARALLGLDKPAEAAAAVAGIPTNFTYDATYSLTGGNNTIWAQGVSARRYSVGDSVEGNGRNLLVKNAIPFFSAKDPRVPTVYTVSTNGKDTTKSQDGLTFSRTTSLWGQTTPTSLTNGIDARLIEAEAAYRAGNFASMMSILNALRAAPQVLTPVSTGASGQHPGVITPVMTALVDPGTTAGRVDLLFREKAFWTFGRGQRLGDMRRLIRQYGRTADQVFPIGTHYRGGNYGADVNLPVTTDEANDNPNFTSCLDRKA